MNAEQRQGNAWLTIYGFIIFLIALLGSSAAAMITHIVVCIKAGSWGLLIAGALLPFIGVIHGWGVWFGIW